MSHALLDTLHIEVLRVLNEKDELFAQLDILSPYLNTSLAYELSLKPWGTEQVQALQRLNYLLNTPQAKKYRHPFWIDLWAFVLQAHPEMVQGLALSSKPLQQLNTFWDELNQSQNPDDTLKALQKKRSKAAKKEHRHLIDLLALFHSSDLTLIAQNKDQDLLTYRHLLYGFLGQIGIISRSCSSDYDLHFLLHLFQAVMSVEPNKDIKPILTILIRRLAALHPHDILRAQHFLDVIKPHPLLNVLLEQLNKNIDMLKRVQDSRDKIYAELQNNETKETINILNQFVQKFAFSHIDGFIHDYQEGKVTYHCLTQEPIDNSNEAERFSLLNRYYYKNAPQKYTKQEVEAYIKSISDFWGAPLSADHLKRQGYTQKYEALWMSHGEILLFDLLAKLLFKDNDLKEIRDHFFNDAQPNLDFWHLMDACDRYLFAYRTSSQLWKDQEKAKQKTFAALIWHLEPLHIEQTPEAFLKRLEKIRDQNYVSLETLPEFCRPSNKNALVNFSHSDLDQLAHIPTYEIEAENWYSRKDKGKARPTHAFLIPLIYEQPNNLNETQQKDYPVYIQAAFVSGGCFDPFYRDHMPFAAALWKNHSLHMSTLSRYLIDPPLMSERQKRVLKDAIAHQWGLFNHQVIGHLFQKDKELGIFNNQSIRLAHRPGDIVNDANTLEAMLNYAATGDVNQSPQKNVTFISKLYQAWTNVKTKEEKASLFFVWLKMNTHDAHSSTDLNMAQLYQTLYNIRSKLSKLNAQRDTSLNLNLKLVIPDEQIKSKPSDFKGNLKLDSKFVTSLIKDAPHSEDTREIGYKAPLNGNITVMHFLAALMDLLTTHLNPVNQEWVKLEKVTVTYLCTQRSFRIEIKCQNCFSASQLQRLQETSTHSDFRKTLYTLAMALNPEQGLQVHQPPPNKWGAGLHLINEENAKWVLCNQPWEAMEAI